MRNRRTCSFCTQTFSGARRRLAHAPECMETPPQALRGRGKMQVRRRLKIHPRQEAA